MTFRIEQDGSDGRESFGPYTYRIYHGNRLIARFWHDYGGDNHGIELLHGTKRKWPFGRMTDFIAGGGLEPLRVTERGVTYLETCLADQRDA